MTGVEVLRVVLCVGVCISTSVYVDVYIYIIKTGLARATLGVVAFFLILCTFAVDTILHMFILSSRLVDMIVYMWHAERQGEERMTIKFYNNNERYGHEGPFEAESKGSLADDMMPTLRDWAIEAGNKCDDTPRDESGNIDEEWIDEAINGDQGYRQEFIAGLEAQYHGEPRIIFDNGGGITLQLPGFAHTYNDAEQCAEDIKTWLDDGNTDDWDGNEEDAVFEPEAEEIANGGYVVYSVEMFTDLSLTHLIGLPGHNVRELYVALARKILNE